MVLDESSPAVVTTAKRSAPVPPLIVIAPLLLKVYGAVPTVTRPVPVTYFDDTKKASFTIKGVYAINPRWSVTAGYAYEKYEYSDEQYNGYRNTIPASSLQDSYLSNLYANPQYKANIVFGLVSYRF